MSELSPSAARVQTILDQFGQGHRVVEQTETTRSSDDAAAAIGCTVSQIAKSLIFRGKESGRPVLVIASGSNRVDEKAVGRLIGEKIERATPEFVREKTGFAIGGVSPLGHLEAPVTLIDEDLLALDPIWAAAGTPNAVFRLTADQLVAMTGGTVAVVKKG